jgi:hypothetical protein
MQMSVDGGWLRDTAIEAEIIDRGAVPRSLLALSAAGTETKLDFTQSRRR